MNEQNEFERAVCSNKQSIVPRGRRSNPSFFCPPVSPSPPNFTMSAPARVPSKPSLKWGKRPTMDAIATQILADMKPGVIENSSKHKAFNLELQGKRVLVESPVITIPYGASSEMKNEVRAPDPRRSVLRRLIPPSLAGSRMAR